MSARSLARRAKMALIRYLVRRVTKGGSIAVWTSELYAQALKDPVLREWLLKSEMGDVFRTLYLPSVHDPVISRYFAERGIDDLYRYVYVMAQEAKLPLAQRAESFSQEGEDLIVGRLFEGVENGFFVDVGAHHPFRFSNTWLLRRRGWRGINIDATPGAMEPFRRWRPDDINIECLVSSDTRPRTYFLHDEPALNTMSEELVKRRAVETPQYRVLKTVTLEARPLSAILQEHLPEGKAIDLLNVDVEGHDLEVLQSNDWEKYRPRVIVSELLGVGYDDMDRTGLYQFLIARGYKLRSKLFNSAIFVQSA
jgi:FkbM family methyltransferase